MVAPYTAFASQPGPQRSPAGLCGDVPLKLVQAGCRPRAPLTRAGAGVTAEQMRLGTPDALPKGHAEI